MFTTSYGTKVETIRFTSALNLLADMVAGIDSSDTFDAQVARHNWSVERAADRLATGGAKALRLRAEGFRRAEAVIELEEEAAAIAKAL